MYNKEKWCPSLRSLFINITQRCNLLCKHCYINPSYSTTEGKVENELDIDLLKNFIDQAIPLGLRSIKITGGEPFLRTRDVLDLCHYAKDRRISIIIETNGTLIDEKIAHALAQAKVNFVGVSLDGAEAETHEALRGVQGCYEKALNAIEKLVSYGINVQIIVSMYKGNIDEYPDILELGMRLGVGSIRFLWISETGRAELMKQDDKISDEERLRLYNETFDNKNITCLSNVPIAFRKTSDIVKRGANACSILNLLGVLADGSISICGMGEHSEKLIIGKVENSNLEDLWKHHPLLLDLRKTVPDKLEGVCSICIHKTECMGFCRTVEFIKTGSFTTPYSWCQNVFDSGLFPENRLFFTNLRGS